jgi:hypothetical protein
MAGDSVARNAPRAAPQGVDKIADLQREVSYGRRVVAFYDVLGWRSHIKRAGQKATDISLLRRLILKTARATRIEKGLDLRVSTFSDNVVISQVPLNRRPNLTPDRRPILTLLSGESGR